MAWLRAFAVALMLMAGAAPSAGADPVEVDLALVLAVDVSNSMDPEEQDLQREGFVQAFRASAVHEAIRSGALGRIAVVYMDWAGAQNHRVVVPWTIIDGPESAADFAQRLDRAPHRRGPRTSISSAIDYAVRLLDESGVEAVRQVIDVSGDGPNNQGRPVTQARDAALAKGVAINGLPIMLKRPNGYWDLANLDEYYRECVIGGPGAFIVPVRERDQFAQAVRTKIIREIAGLADEARLVPAQGRSYDCMAGELQSEQWWRN